MATEVENNVPAVETKEVKEKEEVPADNKTETTNEKPAEKEQAAETQAAKEPPPPKVTVHKANFDKDVVYLYQFSRTPLLPSLSPYCLKVETWLRLANMKYEVSTMIYILKTLILSYSIVFPVTKCRYNQFRVIVLRSAGVTPFYDTERRERYFRLLN